MFQVVLEAASFILNSMVQRKRLSQLAYKKLPLQMESRHQSKLILSYIFILVLNLQIRPYNSKKVFRERKFMKLILIGLILSIFLSSCASFMELFQERNYGPGSGAIVRLSAPHLFFGTTIIMKYSEICF